ncbi:3-deoxy-D-manno-octulosonic acid transferase [bacterium]|nr:3-deoxy-D-manno-octulosonic acid transferase [bacterium]
MRYLYTCFLLLIFPFFLIWFFLQMVVQKKYRRGIAERFAVLPVINRSSGSRCVWVHAASVGEVLAAEPVVNKLKEIDNSFHFYMTTNTDTGHKIALEKLPVLENVFQTPFDFPWLVNRFIQRIRPDMLLLMETEIWPNMLSSCSRRKIPVVLVNGRISDRSFPSYRRFKWFFQPFLAHISLCEMQSKIDADRIILLGVSEKKVIVPGNVKFDRDIQTSPSVILSKLIKLVDWKEKDYVIVAGSTHDIDEERILESFIETRKHVSKSFKLIIAPRHLDRLSVVKSKLEKKRLRYVCRSNYPEDTTLGHLNNTEVDVILLDVMGELTGAYALGDISFVGGTFQNVGGHNLLEPAAHKIPVLFGPNIYNCREVAEMLLDSGGGTMVNNTKELSDVLVSYFQSTGRRKESGQQAFEVVERNRGAVERHVSGILDMLSTSDRSIGKKTDDT